jgi:hypothetical protein
MDKATRGVPRIERLNFLPLLAVEAATPDRRGLLRRGQLQPFEAYYLGDVPELGESYTLLSEAYALPANFFGPTLKSFEGHPSADDDTPHYLVASKNDSRLVRLGEGQLELLWDKLNAFWTRKLPVQEDAGV